jgi:hypothetical protein
MTKAFVPDTDCTSKLLSKLAALKLVPDKLVVPEKVTMSPGIAPCPLTLTVTFGDPFVVVNILLTALFACLVGVMSYRTSLAYMYNFLSVPRAANLVPSKATQWCASLTTPISVLVVVFSQPPIFSGKPYLNRTLSQST